MGRWVKSDAGLANGIASVVMAVFRGKKSSGSTDKAADRYAKFTDIYAKSIGSIAKSVGRCAESVARPAIVEGSCGKLICGGGER